MAVRWYIQSVERQNHQPKILCQTKLSLKTEGKKEIVLCSSHSHKPPPPPPPSGSPVSRRSSGGDDGNPLQYSCLENPRGAWWAAVHEVAKSQARLSDWHFTSRLAAVDWVLILHLWPTLLLSWIWLDWAHPIIQISQCHLHNSRPLNLHQQSLLFSLKIT